MAKSNTNMATKHQRKIGPYALMKNLRKVKRKTKGEQEFQQILWKEVDNWKKNLSMRIFKKRLHKI